MNSGPTYLCRRGNSSVYKHVLRLSPTHKEIVVYISMYLGRAFGSALFDLSLHITTTIEVRIVKENNIIRWKYEIHIFVERKK
jgi:hypothetical protein